MQQLGRIEAQTELGTVWTVDAIAIDLTRPQLRDVAVPDVAGALRQRNALGSYGSSGRAKRQTSTAVACSERSAKLTPAPSQWEPSGNGAPIHARALPWRVFGSRRGSGAKMLMPRRAQSNPDRDDAGRDTYRVTEFVPLVKRLPALSACPDPHSEGVGTAVSPKSACGPWRLTADQGRVFESGNELGKLGKLGELSGTS